MKALFAIGLLLVSAWSYAQITESLDFEPQDSTEEKSVYNLWSIRIHATYRIHGLGIRTTESGAQMRYTPLNPLGIGLGVSYKYLVADFGFVVRTDAKERLRRFDLVSSYYRGRSAVDLIIQRYNGFEARGGYATRNREDIGTTMIGLNYLYLFGKAKMNFGSIAQGGTLVTQSSSGFSLGGYFSYYNMQADSSILAPEIQPRFNEFAEVQHARLTNFGIMAGYVGIISFPKNFFGIIGILPGIGLNFGYLESDERYSPGQLNVKLNFRAALGYSTKKNYLIISSNLDNFLTDVHHNNLYRYSVGRVKLVFGIRLNTHIKSIEKIIPDI